jgi:hypothetical protein
MNTEKLNTQFIQQYKSEFTTLLLEKAFKDKELLNGKDLLRLFLNKQLNLFILKKLFTTWQEEMKRLESPYFDYKNPEVRKSMIQFMNTLSQHIQVNKDTLVPLVEESVEDLIWAVLRPGDYLSRELAQIKSGTLNRKQAKQLTKYLLVHKEQVMSFLEENEELSMDMVIEKANKYFPEIDQDLEAQELADDLSMILEIEKEDFFEFPDHSISERSDEADDEEVLTDTKEEVPDEIEHEQEPDGSVNEPQDEPMIEDSVNMKYDVEAKTLADIHEEKGIDNILESISINHRYMFLQELFDGDNDQFQKAIKEVESCDTFEARQSQNRDSSKILIIEIS